jgi:response regulator RpfG family c-di-GMP phosphodiesterase
MHVTILYVDDEPINLKLFEINFSKKYTVITANSGDDGLSKLDANPDITVVVSDMKMPGMNGVEFIREARHKHKHVAYFILTGFDITPDISKALDEQLIQKYFRKPFDFKEIDASIQLAVQSI